eukprot:5327625-Amphidinium_carterae.1
MDCRHCEVLHVSCLQCGSKLCRHSGNAPSVGPILREDMIFLPKLECGLSPQNGALMIANTAQARLSEKLRIMFRDQFQDSMDVTRALTQKPSEVLSAPGSSQIRTDQRYSV